MSVIIKIDDKKFDKQYYIEWSTILDRPLTNGMDLIDFISYYKKKYKGVRNEDELKIRLERVEIKGTSSYLDGCLEDTILCNRAGKNESNLTLDKIIELYCRFKKYYV